MKRNWISCLVALGCAATMSGGCETVLRQIVGRNAPPANLNAPRASNAQNVARTPMAGLTPLPSGSGLIVFEPVASPMVGGASDNGAKAFASGCGRWLHLHASGQGALGKTPFWGSPEDARRALGLSSLALDAKAARSIALSTGATHFAVGKMEGRGASSTLSLRVHDASTMQVLGAPITASGSRAQIVQSLPRLAREINSRLGVAPIIPARCELNAAEVEAVGRVLWKPGYNTSTPPQQISALQVLAGRSPLAGLLWMRHGSLSGAQWSGAIAQQISLAPSNTLVLGDAARQNVLKTSDQRPIYNALLKKHPHNYLLHSGEAYWNNRNENRAGEVTHAELAARASPKNAMSWSELSGVLGRVAGDVRQARYSGQISGKEWAFLNGVYADSLACAKKAVALSPRDGGHWAQLARASTFGGDYNGAQQALWKSLALDPGNTDAYEWGFQMLQPKWGGSPAQVLKLAQLAASNASKGWIPADDMVGALHTTQQQNQKEALLARIVQADPKNAQALAHYGSCLHYDRRQYKRAEQFYRAALAIDPNYARPLGSLADLHFFVKSDVAGAGKLYRQAIANEPGTASRYEDYARFLVRTGNRNAALRIIKNAQKIGGNRSHPVWAELGVSP